MTEQLNITIDDECPDEIKANGKQGAVFMSENEILRSPFKANARARYSSCGNYTKGVLKPSGTGGGNMPLFYMLILNLGCRGTHANRTNEK